MSPVIIIGHRFVRILRDELSPSDFAEMLSRNRHEPNPAVCHSHDFCDANVYMADAFGGHPMDAGVWNAAWGCDLGVIDQPMIGEWRVIIDRTPQRFVAYYY